VTSLQIAQLPRPPLRRICACVLTLFLGIVGCDSKSTRVSDPQLRPIQEMLDAALPPGTPSAIVNQYVSARGYAVDPAGRGDRLVVIIRHIDREKLQPVTARVTFRFDHNDKLLGTDIVRALTLPQIPVPRQTQPQGEPATEPQRGLPPQ